MKKIIISIIGLSWIIQIYGQNNVSENYFTGNDIYSIAEGLNSMWFATECKIVKMDKKSGSLQFYNHKPNEKCFQYWNYNLMIDSVDRLWLQGSNEIFRFNGLKWSNLDSNKYYNLIKKDQNNKIWYLSDSLTYFGDTKSIKYYVPYSVNDYTFDKKNDIWIASEGKIIKYDRLNFTPYTFIDSSMLNYNVTSIVTDSLKNIWITGEGLNEPNKANIQFVAKFDGLIWKIYTDSIKEISDIGKINSITIDKNQNIWCLGQNGLIKFNDTIWIKEYSIDYGNSTSVFYIDSANNKWLGTKGGGVFLLNDTNWVKAQTSNSGLSGNSVRAIEIDKNGILWIGSDQSTVDLMSLNAGFTKFDNSKWTSYYDRSSEIPYTANAIQNDSQGNMWVANEYYLYKYDGLVWEKFSVNEIGGFLMGKVSMTLDNTSIWVASTYRTLKKFNGSDWLDFSIDNFGSNFNEFYKALAIDIKNNLWVGTKTHLAKYDGKDWFIYKNITDKAGQPCMSGIQTMSFDKNNNLWIGSENGLVKFDGINYTHFKTQNDGSSYHNVYSIAVDDKDNIWIGTFFYGLIKFDGKNWIQFDTSNSDILGNNINTIKIDKDQIWLGSNNGLTKFNQIGGDTIKVISDIITNITPQFINHKELINIYPNPFQSDFIVEYNLTEITEVVFEINDINGKLIKAVRETPYQKHGYLNIKTDNSMIKGIYTGLFITKYGIVTSKLVKL